MKRFRRIFICGLIIGALNMLVYLTWPDENGGVKPGDVWVYSMHAGNPFKTAIHETNCVIAVSNGYVLFTIYDGDSSVIKSEQFIYFKLGSRRIHP